MSNIVVKFRDGSIRPFPEENRGGGSYQNSVKYEGAFVVVTDVWGNTKAFPADLVAEVSTALSR